MLTYVEAHMILWYIYGAFLQVEMGKMPTKMGCIATLPSPYLKLGCHFQLVRVGICSFTNRQLAAYAVAEFLSRA